MACAIWLASNRDRSFLGRFRVSVWVLGFRVSSKGLSDEP